MIDLSFYRGKRVLITGHTGFKGAYLTFLLLQAGACVTGYALDAEEDSVFTELHLSEEKNLSSVSGDIRDFTHLSKVFAEVNPEIVFHLAAQPLVRASYEEPVYTYETNVMGTVNVMECIRNTASVKSVINVTTDKVYENLEKDDAYREDDKLDGYDPYSNSKSCSELVTHSYVRSFFHDRAIAVSTCRAGNVIGGGDRNKDRLLPDAVRAAKSKETFVLRNPVSVRPYQYVLEAITAYLLLAMKQYEEPILADSYNIGPSEEDCYTTSRIADIFCESWGDGMTWESHHENGPHEARLLRLNHEKISKAIGYCPTYSAETAVKKTVEWEKADDKISITAKQVKEFLSLAKYERNVK